MCDRFFASVPVAVQLEAQQNDSRAVHIYTVGKSPEEIVEEILAVE